MKYENIDYVIKSIISFTLYWNNGNRKTLFLYYYIIKYYIKYYIKFYYSA